MKNKEHKFGNFAKALGKVLIVLLIILMFLSIHFHIDWTRKLQKKEYNEQVQKLQQYNN